MTEPDLPPALAAAPALSAAEEAAGIATYLLALEECFLAIRGRGVQWSRADRDEAEAWQRAGVPLGTALRVIQARVRAWKFRHGDLARLPMALAYYGPAVLQAAKMLGPLRLGQRQTSAMPGTPAPSPSSPAPDSAASPADPPYFAELLDPLPQLLAQTHHLALQHAYRKAFDALDEAQRPAAGWDRDPPPQGQPADPLAVLAKIRSQLRKLTVAGLSDGEAAALQAWLTPQVAALTLRLSRKAAAERTAALEEAWLAEHLALQVPTPWGWLDPRDAS